MQTRRFVSIIATVLLLVPTMAPGKVSAEISTGVSAVADVELSEIPSQNAEDFLSEQLAPSLEEVAPVNPPLRPGDEPTLDVDLAAEINPGDSEARPVDGSDGSIGKPKDPPPVLLDDDSSPISTPNPQRLSSLPQSSGKFTADLFSGSASYVYQFTVPEGRAGLSPSFALRYSSARRTELGSAGVHGWDFEVGHIERVSKNGVDKLFSPSSTPTFVLHQPGGSVELVPLQLEADGIHGTYGAKVESDFSLITFEMSNSWTIVDRGGVTWTYGVDTSKREYDPADETRTNNWYVSDAVGPTGATMHYSYTRFSNVVYPLSIAYGGQMVGLTEEAGPFLVQIEPGAVVDNPDSYRTGYLRRAYGPSSISVYASGTLRQQYGIIMGAVGSNGTSRSISGIQETRYSATGVATTLPATTLSYHPVPSTTWDSVSGTTTESFPVYIAECFVSQPNYTSYCYDQNVQIVDVDGDGRQEVVQVQSDGGGSPDGFHLAPNVFRLQTDGIWVADSTWDTVIPSVGLSNKPSFGNLNFMDVNGDSRADVVISRRKTYQEDHNQGLDKRVYLNNGHGWTLSDWQVPVLITEPVLVGDFNGDGLPDFASSTTYGANNPSGNTVPDAGEVYMNTGNGWALDTSSTVPFTLAFPNSNSPFYGDETPKFKLIEMNGDGLVDVVYSWQIDNQAPQRAVFINNGHGWTSQPPAPWGAFENWYKCVTPDYICAVSWQTFTSPAHQQVFDLNGDGIDDVLDTLHENGNATIRPGVINETTIGVLHGLPQLQLAQGDHTAASKSRFGDFNGDGQLDLGWGHQASNQQGMPPTVFDYRRYVQVNQPDNLLQTVTESTGVMTMLEYKEAHQYYDAASSTLPLNTALPSAAWTVQRVTVDPVQGPSQATTYQYEGGASAFTSSTDRELAGFWKVTATSGETLVTTEFHQGLGGLPFTTSTQLHPDRGQFEDEPAKRGRPYRTEVRDISTGQLLKAEVTKWESSTLDGQNRKFVYPSRTTSFDAKADGSLDATAGERTFDLSNGNELSTLSRGSVSADVNTGDIIAELGTDQTREDKQYASATGSRILGAPKLAQVKNSSEQVVAEKEIRYDGLPLGQVSQGKPTRVEDKLPSSAVYASYDAYANVAASSDPRGATSTFEYDPAYHLAATRSVNPLGQASLQDVDLAHRQVASSTDANGTNERWVRDGFGRPLEHWVSNPDTAGSILAERWSYGDAARPAWVRHEAFDVIGDLDPSVDYTYADGAGRVIQTRVLESAFTYIVTDTEYDEQGRVARQSLPYRATGSDYTSPASNVPSTTYAYDVAGRVISVCAPVGCTTVVYDGLVTRITDALGRVAEQERDGLGRLVRVTRWLDSQPVTYNYEWDVAGRLTGMVDPGNNRRDFTYDGQGRLLSQTDWHPVSWSPVYWTYTYDAAGNVVTSTDPRGATIRYTYDQLNRVLTANDPATPGIDSSYNYDSGSYGLGKLHQATHNNNQTMYEYDRLGRVTAMDRNIQGEQFHQEFVYDLVGRELQRLEPNGFAVRTEYDRLGRWSATRLVTTTQSGPGYVTGTSGSLHFTEPLQYAEAVDTPSLDITGQISIEAWVKYPSAPPANSGYIILSKGTDGAGGRFNYSFIIAEGDVLVFVLRTWPAQGGVAFATTTLGDAGTGWHHYAVTFNDVTDTVYFYRDGQQWGSPRTLGVPLETNDHPVRLGLDSLPYATASMVGNLAEVRLWNVERSSADIATNKNLRLGLTSGLVGDWPLYEGAGAYAMDVSGNGNHALLSTTTAPSWSADGPELQGTTFSPGTQLVALAGTYTPLGQLEAVTYGNNLVTQDTYTPADGYRLARRTTGEPGSYLQDLNYTYDAVGNVTHLVDASSVEPLGSNRTFSYDNLDRLTGVQGSYSYGNSLDASSTFTYDILGNMKTRGDRNLYRLTYGSVQPYRASQAIIGGDGYVAFGWDAAGNMVESGSNLYEYDGFGRLSTALYTGGDTFQDAFSYDHTGSRAYRTHDILGDELDPLVTYSLGTYEQDSDGTIRLFLDSPSRRLAQVTIAPNASATVQYLHPDALGSSPLSTDELGEPIAMVDQDVYGLNRVSAGTQPTRSYTGKELDPSGWLYFGARYFSPQMGRFTQVDPVTLSLGSMRPSDLAGLLADPRRLHPYSYGANNPMKYQDPDGEFFDILFDVGFIAYDLYRIGSQLATQGHLEKGELLALGADIGGALIPGATGLGMMARVAMHGDDVAKAGKAVVKATEKIAPDVAKALDHVDNARVTSRGSISGGHDLPKIVKRDDIKIQGLAIDPSTQVPYFWAGQREEFKTAFRLGFTQQEKINTIQTLKESALKFNLKSGWYTDYVGADYNKFFVGGNHAVETFMHAIPHHIPKPW